MASEPKRRAFGHVPDDPMFGTPQVADYLLESRASEEPPSSYSLEHLLYTRPASRPDLPEQLLQYQTSTCVAVCASALVWAEQKRLGVGPEDRVLPSPKASYYAGLRREHGINAKLTDRGSRPRDVWSAMRDVGVVEWEQCPLLESEQSDVLHACHVGAWLSGSDPGYVIDYRYDSVGLSERESVVKRSIFSGHPVGVGLTLDESFEDVHNTPWTGRTGPTTGRHMVKMFAYDPDGIWIQHWWTNWGRPGCIGQISWGVLASLETSDLITTVIDLEKW